MKDFGYTGTYAYFITILTKDRRPYFKEDAVVQSIIQLLGDSAEEQGFAVHAFCFMPDQLHLLIKGLDSNSDLNGFIKLFKQRSGYWFKQKYCHNLRRLSYYDHVLRKDEAIKDTAMYIFFNPVRKGIVSDYKKYPFSGSFTMGITIL